MGPNPTEPVPISVLFSGSCEYKGENKKELSSIIGSESLEAVAAAADASSAYPWALYLYAIKSPATKERYLLRLGKFLDFVNDLTSSEQLQQQLTLEDKQGSSQRRELMIGDGLLVE